MLWEEGGVHALVNEQAVKDAPMSHRRIPFASGEVAEWELVHLAAPAPLCHAFAQVGGTDISVAAAGQVAADLIPFIASMERVTPTSPQLSRITEELRTAQLARYTNPRSSQ